MLQENLDVIQAGVAKIGQQGRQAVPPRVDLADTRARVELDAGLLGKQLVQPVGLGLLQQRVGAVPDQGHEQFPPRHA
jgi:hypothetical protein